MQFPGETKTAISLCGRRMKVSWEPVSRVAIFSGINYGIGKKYRIIEKKTEQI